DVATAAMKAGALDYLVKDRLDAEVLRRAIGSAVRQFRLIEAQRVAEDTLRRHAGQQALLLKVISDLIGASEPGELGRVMFEHISSPLSAVACTNYRLDPTRRRLRLEFAHGIPPEHLQAAQSLELGQEYCGIAAAGGQPVVADKHRIASDPNAGLMRILGATAYACHPLKASDGRLLGTFAVASATRAGFTGDEVVWVGRITNFLAQAWERFEAEQGLRASEERFRSSILHSPVPMLLFDDREQILAVSQSWVERSGYSREALRRIEDWITRACGRSSGQMLGHFRRIISTEPEVQSAELMIRTKDGRDRLWSFVSSALGTQSDRPRLLACMPH